MTFPAFELEEKQFYCEHFRDTPSNRLLIQQFTVKNSSGKNLVGFLQELAPYNEESNADRTYLVKDKATHEIAGYFALRNGLFALDAGSENMFTIPSIELSNFAVNETYRQGHPNIVRIGQAILFDFVIPIAKYIQTLTAVKALYIYALPEDRLIGHYASMGVSSLSEDDLQFIYDRVKPAFDDGCIFMYQIL